MLAKQRFVLDTTAFTDNQLRDKLGDGELNKSVDSMLDLIARSRIKLNISCHMPPITYKEFSDYMSRYECPESVMVKAETWIVKKTPNRYDTQIPSEIFYEYVHDMRERMNKGMKISETAIWEASVESMVMTSRGEKKSKVEIEIIGKAIKDFRKKYRAALRKGTLDSAPDLDVLLLAKELGAGVVAADEGIKVWAERLGLRFLNANSFPKMLKEYLKYYD
ncbi:RNA ligase partner protein [Methanobacterium alcaliphilum]|uniref:RNA ligase partner protein n=1 Tax=Methanobacterium alcaliphilum TaxID=392018 RepID=UPI00200A1B4B|nr:RNA ligase partner protein [Methanobacterium alcaliphilum]MCK9151740.1 RNA ligase partner protein [Methanobacterium alcaliphilum]